MEFNKKYKSTVETVELEIYVELHHKCIVGNDTGKWPEVFVKCNWETLRES